jgi:hypothetical protein
LAVHLAGIRSDAVEGDHGVSLRCGGAS